MEQVNYESPSGQVHKSNRANDLLIKGLITGGLILLMLIPTFFINNLIEEREIRQKEVVKEVSGRWASSQTVSGPYLKLSYSESVVSSEGKNIVIKKPLVLLAESMLVDGKILPEERKRSIYKVLLYKSDLSISGIFKPVWPDGISPGSIDFQNARLCFNISDLKGIDNEAGIIFNKQGFSFSQGIPQDERGAVGLSVPVVTSAEAFNAGIAFNMHLNFKGSEQLHFIPLSATSTFSRSSSWPEPSFDGSTLPSEREVTAKGFTAKWNFNRANLPFGTVLKQESIHTDYLAFGVSMLQQADQYGKTTRSVKYAILFIGLTFALFFVIEIMQKKPFHPVQYVLVGLALVIFYSLILSISEYVLFDFAYLIAALATVILISLYAKSHFKSWKPAWLFFVLLSLLYGFIFMLIQLEDTALLVGSIGLFIVLALVMYASRSINWYTTNSRLTTS